MDMDGSQKWFLDVLNQQPLCLVCVHEWHARDVHEISEKKGKLAFFAYVNNTCVGADMFV